VRHKSDRESQSLSGEHRVTRRRVACLVVCLSRLQLSLVVSRLARCRVTLSLFFGCNYLSSSGVWWLISP
jgi:hypothetical protein